MASLLFASIIVIVGIVALAPAGVAADGRLPLDLKVDGKDDPHVQTYFDEKNAAPGDMGLETIVLSNEGTDDGACLIRILSVLDYDNGITVPEDMVDGVHNRSDGTPGGDLSRYIRLEMTADLDGDGLFERFVADDYLSDVEGTEYFIGLIPADESITLKVEWQVSDADNINIIQSDICIFDMVFFLKPPSSAQFSNLVVPETAYVCDDIPILVDLSNTGQVTGTFTVNLTIDGYEDSQDVTVAAGETVTVEFIWHTEEPGVYRVMVGPLGEQLTVLVPPSPTPGGGGGGGGGEIYQPPGEVLKLDVDMWGMVTSGQRTAVGVLLQTIEAISADGVVTLLLDQGTTVLDYEGNAVARIRVDPEELPLSLPTPPQGSIIGAYNFTPRCNFDPSVVLTIVYDEGALPDGFDEQNLVIEYYSTEREEWVELPTVVDTAANTATAVIGHLTVFAVVALPPPQLTVSNLSVAPREVAPGDEVIISVLVTNSGGTTGSRTIELWIEGEVEKSQEVTLAPGGSRTIDFTVTRDEPGIYRVAVDGFADEFVVVAPGPSYWLIIVWVIGGLLLAAAITYLLLRRRQAQSESEHTGRPLRGGW